MADCRELCKAIFETYRQVAVKNREKTQKLNKDMRRTKEQWEQIYGDEKTPWNANQPEPYLVDLVDRGILKPCDVIDIGCGTGNEAVYLAAQGFTVTGIDISETAIRRARKNAQTAQTDCNFIATDVMEMPLDRKYDFALDRACFHFLDPEERRTYIQNLSSILNLGALFLLIVSSDQETPKNTYQFSKEEIGRLFSGGFDMLSLELRVLETHREKPKPYVCLMEKK